MSPVTHLLMAVNVAIFGLQLQTGDSLIRGFALWPLGAGFEPWQIFTSAFLHGSLGHLFMNMFGIWMFGREVEVGIGSLRYVLLYFASVLTASIAQLAVTSMGDDITPTVGASGGLFGLLGAYAVRYPRRKLILLFLPIPLPAPVFVALYAAVELYAGVYGTQNGIAHFAHIGGLVGGLTLMAQWRAARPRP